MPDEDRPQVVKTDDGRVNLIRPAPLIENLVLRGGGVKGVGNPPALIEMEKRGMLNGLQNIVGTSAGALTALCLASGSTPQQFQKLSDDTPLMSLTKSPDGLSKMYPMVKFSRTGFNAGNALQIADHASATNVSTYLNDNWDKPEFQKKIEGLSEAEKSRLGVLRSTDLTGDRTGKMVTFKDLDMLHKIDSEKFKTLTLTGFSEKSKTTHYFNAKDYPDMPIAIAGRISMSIPVAFASVEYNPGDKLGKRHFVDGGVGSNMPSEVVTRTDVSDPSTELTGRQRENVLVKTGIMTFDEGASEEYQKTLGDVVKRDEFRQNPPEPPKPKKGIAGFFSRKEKTPEEPSVAPLKGAYKSMHGSEEENTVEKSRMMNWVAGNDMSKVDKWDQQKIQESASNCFVIAHGELDTGSFKAKPEEVNLAKEKAAKLMQEQLDQREDQAYAQTFDSIDEVYAELTPKEKTAILENEPDPLEYDNGVDDEGYKADKELYEKVKSESLKESQSVEQGQSQGEEPRVESVRESMKRGPQKQAPPRPKLGEGVDEGSPKVEVGEIDIDAPRVRGGTKVGDLLGKNKVSPLPKVLTTGKGVK